jgi:surfeit locus 1 family protein
VYQNVMGDLDNMTQAGVAGYQVLTPFVPAAGGPAIVVNRGWVPASPYRSELPEVAVEGNERALHGRIDKLPVPALRLGGDDGAGPTALRVLSFPRHEDLERALGRSLVPYQILLDAAEPDGYVRVWAPRREPAHLAYAGQWFALAAATAGGAFFVAVRPWLRRRSGA